MCIIKIQFVAFAAGLQAKQLRSGQTSASGPKGPPNCYPPLLQRVILVHRDLGCCDSHPHSHQLPRCVSQTSASFGHCGARLYSAAPFQSSQEQQQGRLGDWEGQGGAATRGNYGTMWYWMQERTLQNIVNSKYFVVLICIVVVVLISTSDDVI